MKKVYYILTGLILVHIVILFNLQFTAWPEIFSFPYMIDKGFLIYKDFHHVYQPLLTFVLLGVYKIFGFNLFTLKTFTFVLVVLIDLMVFLNVKKITGKNSISFFALLIYILLQPIFDGNMLWFDTAVTLPILLSLYFVQSNYFLTGFFIAIAFLVKQQSALLALPIFFFLVYSKAKLRDLFKFALGGIVPILVLVIFLFKYNIFQDYIFWTFNFPLLELPKIPGYAISPNIKEFKMLAILVVTLLAGSIINFKKIGSIFYLLLFTMLFLVLSAFPRFSLFHLQPALSVFVLLIAYLANLNKKYFVLLLLPVLFIWRDVLFIKNWPDRFYGAEEKKFADEINNISGNSKIYLLGPNSIEYVLSDTVSPKPWIENYVWHFEIDGLQEKVIDGWRIDPPEYIYWTLPEAGEWFELGTYQPKKIVEYINNNYIKVDNLGKVEVWKINKK